MLAHAADHDLVAVARDVLRDRELVLHLATELVEERELHVRADRDGSLRRTELAREELQKRRLARAIAPEDADASPSRR